MCVCVMLFMALICMLCIPSQPCYCTTPLLCTTHHRLGTARILMADPCLSQVSPCWYPYSCTDIASLSSVNEHLSATVSLFILFSWRYTYFTCVSSLLFILIIYLVTKRTLALPCNETYTLSSRCISDGGTKI